MRVPVSTELAPVIGSNNNGSDHAESELYHEITTASVQGTVVLISPYELGRQPFGLAHLGAWLERAGFIVRCLDLSLQSLPEVPFAGVTVVGLYLGMHTATRIAVAGLSRIQTLAPRAHFFAYGLYAPVNAPYLQSLGIESIFGGESEADITELAKRLREQDDPPGGKPSPLPPRIHLGKIPFYRPRRELLPPLSSYAKLLLPDGEERVVGHIEASRGCKHLCRHCPVVPVYQGRFRVIPRQIVLEDIAQQVANGAQHISFGDPDFLNGPTHAIRLVEAMRYEWPHLTFDATVKIEHMLNYPRAMAALSANGCLFLTTAVEAVEDTVLTLLRKQHKAQDFARAVALTRELGIALAPTFVAFTPWTTPNGYLCLLKHLVDLRLVSNVPPIQLAIRLLIPAGSALLQLEELQPYLGGFNQENLGYRWTHPDPRMDELQRKIQEQITQGEEQNLSREEMFRSVWDVAHNALGHTTPRLPQHLGDPIPCHSEPWYCCAEPTEAQLSNI